MFPPVRQIKSTVLGMRSFAISQDYVKGRVRFSSGGLAALPPFGSMSDDPVGQCPLKSDVMSRLLRFNPFMLQNLVAFRLEFAIERRVFQQFVAGIIHRFTRHNTS